MFIIALCAVFALSFIAPIASASAITTWNVPITTESGCYAGTGCGNSNFSQLYVHNSDGSWAYVYLSAILAYVGPVAPNTDTYVVPTGTGTGPAATRASWDYGYGVSTSGDVNANNYWITITDTVTHTIVAQFDPSLVPDNDCWSSVTHTEVNTSSCSNNAGINGFQNFESPSFPVVGGGPTFDYNSTNPLTITFAVTPKDPKLVDPAFTIFVNPTAPASNSPVPEPGTLGMIGGGLALLGLSKGIQKVRARYNRVA